MNRIVLLLFSISLLSACVPEEIRRTQDSLMAIAAADSIQELDTFTVIRKPLLSPEQKQDSIEASQIIREATTIINSGNPDETDKTANSSAIVKNPDLAASFPGGQSAMDLYFKKKLVYPLVAFQNEIKGVVLIAAVIESDGKIGGLTVKKSLGYGCDESALDCIRTMPNWIPAQKSGIKVRTQVTIPVSFGYGN